MIEFHFYSEVEGELFKKDFERYVDATAEVLEEKIKGFLDDKDTGTLTLVMLDDDGIQELNKEHRNMDKPTDVLSFAYMEGEDVHEGEERNIGDVFISVETARRQAQEKGHSLEKELAILFVHGLLHLLGFDHNDDAEEAEMEEWAKKILEHAEEK